MDIRVKAALRVFSYFLILTISFYVALNFPLFTMGCFMVAFLVFVVWIVYMLTLTDLQVKELEKERNKQK